MPKRWAALLAALIALPLILLAIAWLTWPWWSAPLLKHLLTTQQIQLENFSAHRPRWHALIIDDIAATISGDSFDIAVNANTIALTYDWNSLTNKRLESIAIAAAKINIGPAKTPVEKSTAPAAIPLPSSLLEKIPANRIDIADLQMQLASQAKQFDLRGNFAYRDQQVQLHLDDNANKLELQAQADQYNQIALTLSRDSEPIAQVQNQFEPVTAQQLRLHGRAEASLDKISALLPASLQKFSGNLKADWSGTAPAIFDEHFREQLDITGAFDISIATRHALAPKITTALAGQWQLQQQIISGKFARGEIVADAIPPAAVVSLYQLRSGKTLPTTIRIGDDARFNVDLNKRELKAPDLQLSLADKRSGLALQGSATAIELQFADTLNAQSKIKLQLSQIPLGTLHLRPSQLDATLQLAAKKIKADYQWRNDAGHFRIAGTLSHHLTDQTGALQAQLQPVAFAENGNYLPSLLQNWTLPLDFSSGVLKGNARVSWGKQLRAEGAIDLDKIGGFYNRTLIHGIDSHIDASYRDGQLQLHAPRTVIGKIDAGFPITDTTFALASDARAFHVTDFSAQLLGGNIHQKTIDYVRGVSDQQLRLQVEHLQLDRILALQQNVEGDGTLDGEIPLMLHNNKPIISGATLAARAPGGTLRYRGDIPASANPGLTLAFKALQNFHYHTMNIRADYSDYTSGAESGDLALAVALMGRNPEATDTPPVNFNLKIRENIPELLQTLQLGQDISDRIEKRIKTLQQKRNGVPHHDKK